MRMSKDMCGFTGSEADTLRKAIGKKIPKLMAEMKEKFVNGAVKNGVDEEKAHEIWKQLEDFAAYCFNKSHATCYALIAYQTAYLKAHFPDCFMAALMTSDLDNIDRLSIEISECERMGLTVLPPDVNESFADFAVVKDSRAIRFGLAAIKNVGSSVARSIVRERKANGPFQTLEDFLGRCSEFLNKKVLESLVKAGALDRFAKRESLYAGLELLVKASSSSTKKAANQLTIFGEEEQKNTRATITLPAGTPDKKSNLIWEKELLGLYLSDHPLKEYSELLQKVATPLTEVRLEDAGKTIRVGGIVHEVKKITTKSNQMMAFVQLEDLSATVELVIFPTVFKDQQKLWELDTMVLVEGKINDKDGSAKILVDKAWPLEAVTESILPKLHQSAIRPNNGYRKELGAPSAPGTERRRGNGGLLIELPRRTTKTIIEELKTLLLQFPGEAPVELRIPDGETTKIVRTTMRVKKTEELEERVEQLLARN